MKGLAGAHIQNHTYLQQGVYTVTLTAKNQRGTASVSKVIRIEGKVIRGQGGVIRGEGKVNRERARS